MAEKNVYRIIFVNQGKVYELYARHVSQGGLFGFVEVGGLLFGERSAVVVDPSEERLKSEFEGVERFHIPMHAVIRIDEMDREGAGKISELPSQGGNVTPFPGFYTPPGGDKS